MLLRLRTFHCPRVISLNTSLCVIDAECEVVVTEVSIIPGTFPIFSFQLFFLNEVLDTGFLSYELPFFPEQTEEK